jgi:hypothetical protein
MSFYRTGAVGSYLTDSWDWNLLNVTTILLVLTSASSRLLMVDPAEPPYIKTERLLLSTRLFIFLQLVSFLKKMFLPFAIFVSGILKVRKICGLALPS